MTERQIQCFLVLAKTLNFRRTAEELYLTQPAVSQQIRALEADLGVTLFTRRRNSVALAPAGVAFYTEAENYLSYSRALVQRVRQQSARFTSRLEVAYAVSLRLMPQLLQEFGRNRPETLVHFYAGNDMNLAQNINYGHCDVAVAFADPVGGTGGEFCELYHGGYVCIVPQGHALAGHSVVRAQDLRGETLFTLSDGLCNSVFRRLNGYLQEQRLVREVCQVNDLGEAAILAEAGYGVAVLPHVFAQPHLGAVHIPFDYFEEYSLGLMHRADAGVDARLFCSLAQQLCAGDNDAPLIG